MARSRTTVSAMRRANRSSPYVVQDAGELLDRVLVEDVGGGRVRWCRPSACRGARPRRRRSRARARRAASRRRRGRRARRRPGGVQLLEDVGDLVVHRVDQGHPLAVRRQALAAALESVLVAVDADQPCLRAVREHGLRVAAEAEGGVDEEGVLAVGAAAGAPPARRPGRAGPGHGGARPVGVHAASYPASRARSISARASPVEAAAENAITAAPSRTSCRTRRGAAARAAEADGAGGGSVRFIGRPLTWVLVPGWCWAGTGCAWSGSSDQVPVRSPRGALLAPGKVCQTGGGSGRETSSYDSGCGVVVLCVLWGEVVRWLRCEVVLRGRAGPRRTGRRTPAPARRSRSATRWRPRSRCGSSPR